MTTSVQKPRAARAAVIVMLGLATSTVVGLVRQRIISNLFGTSFALDAFNAADDIPSLLFAVFSGGALAFAFLPIYSELLAKEDSTDANKLFSKVVNLVFLALAVVGTIVLIFTPAFVRLILGPDTSFPVETQELTGSLMRILVFSTVLFSLSGMVTAALHAHQHFLLPAFSPAAYSVGIILGARFLSPTMGIYGLAWGTVLGAFLHLALQLPAVFRYGIRWQPLLDIKDAAVRRFLYLMAPRVVDLMLARIAIDIINTRIGGGLGEGRVSALNYGYRLMNMPETIIGTAIGIVMLPTLAAYAAQRDTAAQRTAFSGAIRAILTLALPAAVGLIVLGEPIIRVLFYGGAFDEVSLQLTYFGLQFYALVLISQSLLEVVVRAFAANQDTYTPLYVSFFTTAVNIGLAYWLTRPLAEGGVTHGGLPLANAIAVGLEVTIGMYILSRRWNGIDAKRILLDAAKAGISAVVMGVVIVYAINTLALGSLLSIVVGGGLGMLVYFLLATLLGIREIRTLPVQVVKQLFS